MHSMSIFKLFSIFLITGFMTACATQVTEKPSDIKRSTVPLSEYDQVVLVGAELLGEYAGQGANEKAKRKIDQVMESGLQQQFENFSTMSVSEYQANKPTASGSKQVLVIQPVIKQIKFVGGAARFWAGAMAGSSVVIMDVNLIDAGTNERIGVAGYYRKASAYGDGFGIGSNRMLEDVANDVVNYVRTNM